MHNIPLHSFLISLSRDGIILSVRDYERIARSLQTGGEWDMLRLKHVLLSLIAKSEEQQELLGRRFNKFFDEELEAQTRISPIEIEQIIQVIRGERIKEEEEATSGERGDSKSRGIGNLGVRLNQEGKKNKKHILQRWILAILLLLIGCILAYYYWPKSDVKIIENQREIICNLESDPIAVDFLSETLPGEKRVKTLRLKNPCEDSILLLTAQLEEEKLKGIFEYKLLDSLYIGPDGEEGFQVIFSPVAKDSFSTTFLNIYTEYQGPKKTLDSLQILLRGSGKGDDPIPPAELIFSHTANIDAHAGDLQPSEEWIPYVLLCLLFAFMMDRLALYMLKLDTGPIDKVPKYDKAKNSYYNPGEIGGSTHKLLDDAVLSEMADSMGYFQSERSGKVLDVPASIKLSLNQGGIPTFEFLSKSQLRTLLILEDGHAERTAWNPIVAELAQGMEKYRVPVIHGKFFGSPESFRGSDGITYQLDDLEDQREGILLLLFTDGEVFYRRQNRFVLEKLASWPMVAWMELKERRFWDETTQLPLEYGIPLFPATQSGTYDALSSFLTESAIARNIELPEASSTGIPAIPRGKIGAWLENVLQDSLAWLQDCSMIQPLSPGMADALRRKFHPHIPPEQIEYLHNLSNTSLSDSGFRFSREVLKALREGFSQRRTEKEQETVIHFILEQIEAAKPDEAEDSLAYLSWEMQKERVKMELGGEEDNFKRLGELLNSPLAKSLSDSLGGFSLEANPESEKIPLLRKPKNQEALLRLRNLPQNPLNIPSLLKSWHWVLLALFFISTLGTGVRGWILFQEDSLDKETIKLVEKSPDPEHPFYASLERYDEKTMLWEYVQEVNRLSELPRELSPDSFKINVYQGFDRIEHPFRVEAMKAQFLEFSSQTKNRLIRQELFDGGLIVKSFYDTLSSEKKVAVTPDNKQGWSDRIAFFRESMGDDFPEGRELSIAIEIVDERQERAALNEFHNTLFRTGSIDFLYSIRADLRDRYVLDTALAYIEKELAPWIPNSQLLTWEIGANTFLPNEERQFLRELGFARILSLAASPNFRPITQLRSLFEPHAQAYFGEQELQNLFGNALEVKGEGKPLWLLRPSKKTFELIVNVTPANAKISLIKPEEKPYQPGMELKPGSYLMRVEAPEFISQEIDFDIMQEKLSLEVVLEKIKKGEIFVKTEPAADTLNLRAIRVAGDETRNFDTYQRISAEVGRWVLLPPAGYFMENDSLDVEEGQLTEVVLQKRDSVDLIASIKEEKGVVEFRFKPDSLELNGALKLFVERGDGDMERLPVDMDSLKIELAAGDGYKVVMESDLYQKIELPFEVFADSVNVIEIPLNILGGDFGVSFVPWDSVIYSFENGNRNATERGGFAKYSPTGKYVAVTLHDVGLKLLDKNLNEIANINSNNGNDFWSRYTHGIWDHTLEFSPDEKFLFIRDSTKILVFTVPELQKFQTLSLNEDFQMKGEFQKIYSLDVNSRGDLIACGTFKSYIFLWEKTDGKFMPVSDIQLKRSQIVALSFLWDDRTLFTWDGSSYVQIFINSRSQLEHGGSITLKHMDLGLGVTHSSGKFSINISPKQKFLATSNASSRKKSVVELIEKEGNNYLFKKVVYVPEGRLVLCNSFSPNGELLVVGSGSSQNLYIYTVNSPDKEYIKKLNFFHKKKIDGGITGCFFSPDGNYLLGTFSDTYRSTGQVKIKIWKVIYH